MNSMASPASHRLESLLRGRIGGQFRDLEIISQGNGIVLHGLVHSYYAKQLAQHLAMELTGQPVVANEIEVA